MSASHQHHLHTRIEHAHARITELQQRAHRQHVLVLVLIGILSACAGATVGHWLVFP